MNPLTHEWLDKAEADYRTARRELRARKQPNYDAVCFHAQQCGEEYLKARLHAAGVRFPKAHDLSVLLDLVLPIDPEWELLRGASALLTDYAVRFRYPGAAATKAQARAAVEPCELIRERVRLALRLKTAPTPKRSATSGRKRPAGKARLKRK